MTSVLVDHLADDVLGHHLDLRDLVRGAEAVEEVQEGNPALERGRLRDQGEVHRLLDAGRTEHGKAGACGRSITSLWSPKMDSACVASVRAVMWKTVGVSSPAILNMLGILSSKPWDGGEGAGQRAGLERAVHRAGRAAFALHLHHRGDGAPEVLDPFGGPLVAPLAHVGGGGDGIDAHHFVAAVGHVGHRFIAVNCRIGLVHGSGINQQLRIMVRLGQRSISMTHSDSPTARADLEADLLAHVLHVLVLAQGVGHQAAELLVVGNLDQALGSSPCPGPCAARRRSPPRRTRRRWWRAAC